MKCSNPKCESEDVVRCEIAYEQGTHRSKSSGSYMSDDGTATSGTHESETVTRTPFAERAAPPVSGISHGIGAVLSLLFILLIMSAFTPPDALVAVMWLAIAGAIVYTIWRIKQWPDHRRKKAVWDASWICRRCGTIFQP
jgi:hypothetical protein